MTNQHPLTPPPELVQQWYDSILNNSTDWRQQQLCTLAAQWGADQELEACQTADMLRAARRPKPPSLKEQALAALAVIPKLVGFESEREAIRRALEALDD